MSLSTPTMSGFFLTPGVGIPALSWLFCACVRVPIEVARFPKVNNSDHFGVYEQPELMADPSAQLGEPDIWHSGYGRKGPAGDLVR